MKVLMVFLGVVVAVAATPALAGGDYDNPWADITPAAGSRHEETVYMPPSRRVTGEEVDHHKAPIYFYAPQN